MMRLKAKKTSLAILYVLYTSQALGYEFDLRQLEENTGNVDISVFNDGGQLPGLYPVDIYVNNKFASSKEVYFYNKSGKGKSLILMPCLSREDLQELDILENKYPDLHESIINESKSKCLDIEEIPESNVTFNITTQHLYITVPQIAVRKEVAGLANKDKWDDGITAFRMNYDINGSVTRIYSTTNPKNKDLWGTLQPGLNFGSWRVRNISGFNKKNSDSITWNRGFTNASTSLPFINSGISLGDVFTSSDLFTPAPIRGFTIGTDESMIPQSLRSFSPIVKGIARTQARVTVISNGVVLLSETVPAGPFVLDQLPLYNDKGELQVTIQEADGQKQTFTVPWQTPAIAVPEGYLKYNIGAGEYKKNGLNGGPAVYQATSIYGINEHITIYGGYQGSTVFDAYLAGFGSSLGYLGSASLDFTLNRKSKPNSDSANNNTLRFRYTNQLEDTGTGFQFEAIRYSSPGNYSLESTLQRYNNELNSGEVNGPKTQISLSLNQSARQYGAIYLNSTLQNNFDRSRNTSLGGGYSLPLFDYGYVMLDWYEQSYFNSRNKKTKQNIVSMTINLPLKQKFNFPADTSYRLASYDNKNIHEYSLNGSSDDQKFFWNASHTLEKGTEMQSSKTTSTQIRWFGNSAQTGAWFSQSSDYDIFGGGLSGGIMIHKDGVTFGQPYGETVALVDTGGGPGIGLFNTPTISTDSRGFVALPSLTPYQTTNISIDPTTLSDNVELDFTDKSVTPTRGAIVLAKYETSVGHQALFTLKTKKAISIPFGAIASLKNSSSTGIVDEHGRVFISGLPDSGEVEVKWNKSRCFFKYNMMDYENDNSIKILTTECY
ncbi:TPA: fimbria/pilus outer membrane usher protein [Enterobacter asburiae]